MLHQFKNSWLIGLAFDGADYAEANPDVVAAGVPPLKHFLSSGLSEGRAPSRSVSNGELRRRLGLPEHGPVDDIPLRGLAMASVAALRPRRRPPGQALRGEPQQRRTQVPNLAFVAASPAWKGTYEDAEAVIRHARSHPELALPLDFHLRLDLPFFRAAFSELAEFGDGDLYLRWLDAVGMPHEYGSEDHLLRANGIRSAVLSPSFDHHMYLATNADLPNAWTKERALVHFVREGICEGRFAADANPSLLAAARDRIRHAAQRGDVRAAKAAALLTSFGAGDDYVSEIVGDTANHHGLFGYTLSTCEAQNGSDARRRFVLHSLRADAFAGLKEDDGRVVEAEAALRSQPTMADGYLRHERALKERFDRQRHKAVGLTLSGEGGRGRALIESAIATLAGDFRFYGASGPAMTGPRARRDPLRIGLLADTFLPQCRLYRVDQKIEQLRGAGFEPVLFDFRTDMKRALGSIALFDLWIVYRTPALFEIVSFVEHARKLRVPTAYEIDDLLFDATAFPPPIEDYAGLVTEQEYANLSLTPAMLRPIAERCFCAIVSTSPLARAMVPVVGDDRTYVHPNGLGSEHLAAIKAAEARSRTSERGSVTIFYGSGTKAHKSFVDKAFLRPLFDLMTRRPEVRFETIGYLSIEEVPEDLQQRVRVHAPVWNVQEYWARLAKADINVAILDIDPVTDAKSEIKWLEAGMLGVPSILSPTATYREVVRDGETGLFARTPDEWSEQLLRLIDSEAERHRIGEAARQAAFLEYSPDAMTLRIAETMRSVMDAHDTYSRDAAAPLR